MPYHHSSQTFNQRNRRQLPGKSLTNLVLRQDKEFGLAVVDLAKDPLAAGPLARSTTRNSIPDKALATTFERYTVRRILSVSQKPQKRTNQ
jgi:hypothetical protein